MNVTNNLDTYTSFPQDVDINQFENNKLKSQKKLSNLFVKGPSNIGLEAYTQLLPPIMKMGRIFRLRKTINEYPKIGIFLKQQSTIGILPLVKTHSEVTNIIKLLFGTNMYKRMVYNYIFPRKIEYKNPIIPGSKKLLKISNPEDYIDIVKRELPKLTQLPSYIIRNIKNAVFDYTDVLNQTIPNRDMCVRPAVLKTSDELILQTVARLCFTGVDEFLPLYKNFKTTLPPIADVYNSLIIPFEIEATNMKLATVLIDPNTKNIPLVYRRDPIMSKNIGMLKFVIGLLNDDPFEDSPLKRQLADKIKQKDHVIFIFHNKTHAFYIDYQEFKNKGYKFDAIYRFIRSSLKLIISLNIGDVSPVEIDDNYIDNYSDGESEKSEDKVDKKISINKEFSKSIVEHMKNKEKNNIIITKTSDILDDIDESIGDSNVLLAKAKKRFEDRIALGQADVSSTANASQTPISKDPEKTRTIMEDLSKIDKFKNIDYLDDDEDLEGFDDDDEEKASDGDETGKGIDDEDFFSNGEESEDNENETKETDEDDEYEDELEGKQYAEEQKAEQDEEHKKAIINSVRETIEGKITDKQRKYLDSIKDKYKSIKYDENETLEDVLERSDTIAIDINDNDLRIKSADFNKSILTDFTKSYTNKTLSKDIVSTVKSFSDENKSNQLIIVGFEKKDVSDQFNKVERYRFELKDKTGKSHNITFKMPIIDEDGFMYLNGNKKLLKKQWILKPVTKTAPDDVYVMSNYNKVHIFRSGNVINKNTIGLDKFLKEILLNQNEYSGRINVDRGDNSKINLDYDTSIEYDSVAEKYNSIVLNKKDLPNSCMFYFNQTEIRKEIDKLKLKFDPNGTKLPIGIKWVKGTPTLLVSDIVDTSDSVIKHILNTFEEYFKDSGEYDLLIKFISSIKSDSKKMCSKIEVQSKTIPLVVFLSGMFGFSEVLNKSGIKTVFIKKGTSKHDISEENLSFISKPDINSVKFMDGTLYYETYPIDSSLFMNGLKEIKPEELNLEDLDNMGTYVDYTFKAFKSRNLIRGWIAFRDMFLDPKTVECLNALHLPTNMIELFMYANSLLQNNAYKYSSDVSSWRIRDYEMLNSFLYESISENYRQYMQKGKSRYGFSIPEDDILTRLNKSFVIDNYDSTSPANELKERGAITYKGPNGINSDRAFTLDKRGQTLSGVGTVALSSPDNSNVGIVKQLTANPRIINTLGFVESTEYLNDADKLPASSLVSYEEGCIPYINHDNPQRIGFATSQTKHVVPAKYFDPPMIGTGAESILPYVVSNSFGYKASEDGKVIKVDEENKFLIIKYKSGAIKRIDFGEGYDKNSDFYLQNNIECNVKEGQSIKKGSIVTYNKDYFKKYMGKLVYAQGSMARIAVHEGEVTEEDSSAISWRLSAKLATTVIKRKQIVIGANANIVSSVKVGDHVLFGDPLMVYENSENKDDDMALLELLGDADESVLDKIARHKASANYTGVIKDIKIYWSIEPDQMGESTRKFIKQYIAKIKKDISSEESSTGKPSEKRRIIEVSKPSGPMKDRINGVVLPKEGGILVEYFIEHTADKRPGDKVSCHSSLKTVINKVMDKEECAYRINPKSKFNTIDFIQSSVGVMKRMVTSIYLTGFLSKIVFERGKEIGSEFLEEIGEK